MSHRKVAECIKQRVFGEVHILSHLHGRGVDELTTKLAAAGADSGDRPYLRRNVLPERPRSAVPLTPQTGSDHALPMRPSRAGPSRRRRQSKRHRLNFSRIVFAGATSAPSVLNEQIGRQWPKLSDIPLGSEAGESVKATGGREAHFDEVLGNADLEIGLDWTTTHGSMVGCACVPE
jgi:hypothetical protein